jgi:uncharacterized protein YycO
MPTLTIIYCRSITIGGILIRAREPFGKWSHCGIVTGNNSVVEARAFHGVTEGSLSGFLQRYPTHEICKIECPDPDSGIAWARTQVGKSYDYLSILGLATRNSWQDNDKWQCSELVETAIEKAGRVRFRKNPSFISPNMSWMSV